MPDEYADMLNLPYPFPTARPRMSMAERAAQFSPFAALSGYGAAVRETARQTDAKIALSEDEKALLDRRLQILLAALADKPAVSVTYFRPDGQKGGGAYLTASGTVKKLDNLRRLLLFDDGAAIPLADIVAIEGELFAGLL